ncbi:2-phosphosulfolactate phosphatase [Prauserella sediminis]|uniref:Probable 2-phosphosulfolactate phosphatase n=1 Tax=Prauserella sediminis TaxID=577680 RepID=A0A839XQR5_9PSEU|nr:2-phosphosulfolactate phosphatase [Prauserella sediminis]MBB3664299.1 2-phosphosulfolactate phosphatase [Prauserella sediminis]
MTDAMPANSTPTTPGTNPATTQTPALLAQDGHDVRLDWGASGLAALGGRCAVLVIVDVLSFSTRVDLLLAEGTAVQPVRWTDTVTEAPSGGAEPVQSPNGATLTADAATTGAHVLTACLRNADAVAKHAADLAAGEPIGVLAAGERWGVAAGAAPGSDGPLRPCVEDQLGAGAVVAGLQSYGDVSPEAVVAAQAFAVADVPAAVSGSASGRELTAHGDGEIVERAVEVGMSAGVPILGTDGVLTGA